MNPSVKMVKCRVCLGGGRQLIPFARFDTERKPYRLGEAIAVVGGVLVEDDDGLPQYCCVRCLREVEAAYKLRQRCQESDRKMREMFGVEVESVRLMRIKPGVSTRNEEVPFKEKVVKSQVKRISEAEPAGKKINDASTSSGSEIIADGAAGPVKVKEEVPQEDTVEIKTEKEDYFETEELSFKEEIEESRLQEPVEVSTIKQEIVTETIEDPQLQLTYDVMEVDECVSHDQEEAQSQEQESSNEKEEYVEVVEIVESSEEEKDVELRAGVFKCCSCKQSYRTTKELEEHVKIVGDNHSAKELETKVQCKVYTTTVLASLRINRQFKNNNFECRASSNDNRPQLEDDAIDKSRICCGCTQFCGSPEELIAHSQEVHQPQQPASDEQRPWVCDICFQNFPNRIERFEHKQRFRKTGKKFPCQKCGKGFFTHKSWQKHQKTHSPELNSCHMCSYVSICSKTLKNHVKRHSMHDGTFLCLVCARCYDSPEILANHSTSHSSKVSLRCPHCPRSFNVESWLTKHINRHIKEGTVVIPVKQVDNQEDMYQ